LDMTIGHWFVMIDARNRAHLTNDENRAHLPDLKQKHIIDQV